MAWCENNATDYLFGLPGNKVYSSPSTRAPTTSAPVARERKAVLRGYAARARIEATTLGLDIRFVVTNLDKGSAEHIYDVIHSARGQAENLVKMHNSQLASDRTSCRSPIATRSVLSCTPPHTG